MYALQAEPEKRSRWRVLAGATLLAGTLISGTLLATSQMTVERRVTRERPRMQTVKLVQVAEEAPPVEAPPVPPAEPLPKPQPKPQPRKSSRLKPPPKAQPKPQPQQSPVQAAAAPEATPLVVGLTLSSVGKGGRGPKYAVGNTLMGTPDTVAVAPKTVRRARAGGPPSRKSRDADSGRGRRTGSKQRVAAKLQRGPRPHYPRQAKAAGVEGVVVLAITIGRDGRVATAKVLRGLGHGLDESAKRAAQSTHWSPALLDGDPVSTTRRFNVRFSLQS